LSGTAPISADSGSKSPTARSPLALSPIRFIAIVGLIFTSLGLFALLAIAVQLGGPADKADFRADAWVSYHVPLRVKLVALVVVRIGDPEAFIPIAIVVAIAVAICRKSVFRGFVIIAALGCVGATSTLIKLILPSERLFGVPAALHAFPSTHTASTATLLGVVALVTIDDPRRRVWALAGAAAGGLFMGAAMLLIQGHWMTDVIGGMLLAAAMVAATRLVLVGR
jgi:membrane-associated phospholipid phosphatase